MGKQSFSTSKILNTAATVALAAGAVAAGAALMDKGTRSRVRKGAAGEYQPVAHQLTSKVKQMRKGMGIKRGKK